MIKQLVFASQNQGKIAEVRAWLAPFGISVASVADFEQTKSVEVSETAATFEGNALLKATEYAKLLQLPVLADDSGLEVIALANEPGVASNRWFPGTDADRNHALLARLKSMNNRSARFVTVLYFFNPVDGATQCFRGEVSGHIADQPQGTAGFGYDPLFIPEGQQQSFAQLGVEFKNTISHRARALEKFAAYLRSIT